MLIEFEVPGEPQSKARARVSGGRAHTPRSTVEAQKMIGWLYRQAAGPARPLPDVGFGVEVTFYRADRQRRDVDNMCKLLLDGLTGLAWADDSQVTDLTARVRRDGPARTEVRIYTTDDYEPAPTEPCVGGCGARLPSYASWRARHCPECWQRAEQRRVEARPVCEQCGDRFVRQTGRRAANRYCSIPCRHLAETVEVRCEVCSKVERFPRSIAARRRTCSKACRTEQQRGAPRGAPRVPAPDPASAPATHEAAPMSEREGGP